MQYLVTSPPKPDKLLYPINCDYEYQLQVTVLDKSREQLEVDIKYALDYYARGDISHVPRHQVQLRIVISRDSDSYAAVEKVCALLEDGVSLILDITSPHLAPIIRSMAEFMAVPYISAVDESYFSYLMSNTSMSLNIQPPATEMLNVITDIVQLENLSDVAIIYDGSFDLSNVPRRILTDVPAEHMYLRMALEESELALQVARIRDMELSNFFLVSSASNAERFLGKASSENIIYGKLNFFVLTKNSKMTCVGCYQRTEVIVITGTTSYTHMVDYVTFVKMKNPAFNPDRINMDGAFVFDSLTAILRAIDSVPSFVQYNYSDCFIVEHPPDGASQQTVAAIQAVKENQYSGVFGPVSYDGKSVVQRISLTVRRQVFSQGNSDSEDKIGNWTRKDGLYSQDGSITRRAIRRRYRVVTISTDPPFVFLDPERNNSYVGYCIDLLDEIASIMNFDYDIYSTSDGLYGNMDENGTWNGVIGELVAKNADIAVGTLSVMAERENVVDFTVPYYDLVGITILMRKPKVEYSLFKFMTVLDWDVWGCSVAAFFVVSTLLFLFDRFSPYSYQNNRTLWTGEGAEPRVFSIKEGIWFCMMSLTPQGGGEAPRALSGRLIAATWWLFGFIMIAIYTANLAAFLTVSRLETNIESLDDLAKQFKTQYAPLSGSSSHVYFERMAAIEQRFYSIWKDMSLNDSMDAVERAKLAVWDYPVSDKFTNMWESMVKAKFPTTMPESIERVLNEDFAYIGDATENKYATMTNCELWQVGEEFSRKPYAFAVQDGVPLKTEISNVILQLLNQRFLEELKSRWWEYKKIDCPKVEDEGDGISISNIGGVFLVITIGTVLGLITLAIEYYLYRYRPNKESSKTEENGTKSDSGRGRGSIFQNHLHTTISIDAPNTGGSTGDDREMNAFNRRNNNTSSDHSSTALYNGVTNMAFTYPDIFSERL